MQVRNGKVRGFGLHLKRLSSATRHLFAEELDQDTVRHHIRLAMDGESGACSVRVDVFHLPAADGISVMVTVRPPADMPAAPQHLKAVVYQRPVAHIKHVGTFAQIYYGQLAEHEGFDDALLVGSDETISEAAIANIGFVDSESIVWPDGPGLPGITWQLLDAALPAHGMTISRRTVRLSDLASFRTVFVMNSIGVAAVGRVDDTELLVDDGAIHAIQQVHNGIPWDEI